MSYNTMEQAKARADEVKAMMTHPEKWDVKVWRNMGWHWQLKSKSVSLYESFHHGQSHGFWCLMSRDMRGGGGNPDWSLSGHPRFDNPNEAVKAQVECARVHVDIMTKSVEHGESLL